MSLGAKAAVAWLILFVLMVANGLARVVLLQPWFGDNRARQVASLTGVILVLLVSSAFVSLAPQATSRQLLRVGVGWLAGTLAFEFLFGHFVSGLSWSALLADYDILAGRLWSLVLLSVCLGPWLCGVLRGRAR